MIIFQRIKKIHYMACIIHLCLTRHWLFDIILDAIFKFCMNTFGWSDLRISLKASHLHRSLLGQDG